MTPFGFGDVVVFRDVWNERVAFEMPARGVQGAMNDSLQHAIPGTGAPGKYLVLGPGQNAPDNVDGFIVRRSPTVNIFLGVPTRYGAILHHPDHDRQAKLRLVKALLAHGANVNTRTTKPQPSFAGAELGRHQAKPSGGRSGGRTRR